MSILSLINCNTSNANLNVKISNCKIHLERVAFLFNLLISPVRLGGERTFRLRLECSRPDFGVLRSTKSELPESDFASDNQKP
jgi:hypothetical protein